MTPAACPLPREGAHSQEGLAVLIIEDSADDAALLERALRKGGLVPMAHRVETAAQLEAALTSTRWDVALCDWVLPGFAGLDALEAIQRHNTACEAELPVILTSGVITEEMAVAGLKAGAEDFVLKDNMARLVPAIERALRAAEMRRSRREGEDARADLNRVLRTITAVQDAIVRLDDEADVFDRVCARLAEVGGYPLAWIGLKGPEPDCDLRVAARAGRRATVLDGRTMTWAPRDLGLGPSGTAVRTGAPVVVASLQDDPMAEGWRDHLIEAGMTSIVAFPLRVEGEVVGQLTLMGDATSFPAAETELLDQLAQTLAFAVRALRTRSQRDAAFREREGYLHDLHRALHDVIGAIATTMEVRDPYTAGHQKRVAALSVAIARRMGLAEERIHGLELAAIVHDIGKIQVPQEILSRPGRISDLEFTFIKQHTTIGHDILKGIAFPWPIADVVWQHHERLDGSGYPQGLSGDAILLEARILAIADTVEAMASHRPYRAGLGVAAALEELRAAAGIRYDVAAVEACLAVFAEGYELGP